MTGAEVSSLASTQSAEAGEDAGARSSQVTSAGEDVKLVHRPVTSNLSFYKRIVRPVLFRLPAESAHEFATSSLSLALKAGPLRDFVRSKNQFAGPGKLSRFGLEFENPVGLAAGFDKNGTAAQALGALGFGFIEVGTVTSEAQPGNERPRLFRLPKDRALINRLGFNNSGAAQLAENIRRHRPGCILGINIGKARRVAIEDAIADYLTSFEAVHDVADYIAVNVSSPNTPNLRQLQQAERLQDLLSALQQRNQELAQAATKTAKPLLLKVAPDLSDGEIESIIAVATSTNVSGIIATNTTVSREGLVTDSSEVEACGEGGLSGAPLQQKSNRVISLIYRLTRGALPIVGVGGVFSAADAWEKICAGASLIQLYTGFIYEGPRVAHTINQGLAEIMKRENVRSIDEAVGSRTEI